MNNEKLKYDFVINILLNVITQEELVSAWNKMCRHTHDISFHKACIFDMKDAENILLSDMVNGIDQNIFSLNDKYFAYDANSKLVSFSVLNDYTLFDVDALCKYLLFISWEKLQEHSDEALQLLLSQFEDTNNAAIILNNLIRYNIIDIYRSNWDKVFNSISGLIKIMNNE